jgi:hypothetical protein
LHICKWKTRHAARIWQNGSRWLHSDGLRRADICALARQHFTVSPRRLSYKTSRLYSKNNNSCLGSMQCRKVDLPLTFGSYWFECLTLLKLDSCKERVWDTHSTTAITDCNDENMLTA